MMKYFYLVILLVIFGCFRIVSPACQQRNEDQAKGDDPTRVCRKACTTDSDCSGSLKKCLCDDFCGLSCFNPDAECDNITGTLDNGTISFRRDSLKYGARATYRCNRGYSIRGEPVRECRSTKKWSRQPPTCIRSCPAPKKIGYAYFNHFTEHDVYEPGVTVSYKCLTGRNPSGNPNVTCQPSYTWSTLNLLCVLKDCGSPPNILNGDYTPKGRTTFGTWITYFCDKGYRTTDVKTKTLCVSSGIWNTQAPTCKPVQCPPPISRLKNGRVIARGRAPWEYRRLITFHCNDGYLIDGKDSQLDASCNENGSWGETPSCAGVQCPPPPSRLKNGRISEDGGSVPWEYQDSITFRCNDGYLINGKDSLMRAICNENGTWGEMPSCEDAECDNITGTLDNGRISFRRNSLKYISHAIYSCNTGYSIHGESVRICKSNRKWSHQPSTCIRVQCPPPPSRLENGRVTVDGGRAPWEYQDSIIFQCDDGYLINGKDSLQRAICNENGTWGETPSCEEDSSSFISKVGEAIREAVDKVFQMLKDLVQ